MRYGYWMPVFGGWLRNVADENRRSELAVHAKKTRTAQREEIGFDVTLLAELHLNDIKAVPEAPSMDGVVHSVAALAAVTSRLELMRLKPCVQHYSFAVLCSRNKPPTSITSATAASR